MPSVQDQTSHVAAIASVGRLEARVEHLEHAIYDAARQLQAAAETHGPTSYGQPARAILEGVFEGKGRDMRSMVLWPATTGRDDFWDFIRCWVCLGRGGKDCPNINCPHKKARRSSTETSGPDA